MTHGTWVADFFAGAVGLAVAALLASLLLALALSVPVVLARAVQVLVHREWIPIVYNLRCLRRRKLMTLMTAFALALVVFVLTAVSMLALGIQHTLASTGNERNVKVLYVNSLPEWTSWIGPDQLKLLDTLPGVAKDASGMPLVSGELVVLIWLPRQGSRAPDDGANLSVRGVHQFAFDVHRTRGIQGQHFQPGTQQIVLGKALVGRFEGATLGGVMRFADREWSVVGIMDHGGSAHDSEIWGDFDVLAPTFRRGYSTATVVLSEQGSVSELSAIMSSMPVLSQHLVKREADYWRGLSEQYVGFVRILGSVVTVIFSFGAILGALNTMYAQVAARTREIGMLRAIGFKPRAILTSILAESLLLSLAGGGLGVLAASFLGRLDFNLTTVQTLSEITYGFHLSPGLAIGCIGFAALMGYAGGLLPALRASRIPIVDAVRAN